MKRVISLILLLLLCISVYGCGKDSTLTKPSEETKPSVDSIVEKAILQYPSSNGVFKYNVYDTYVEITEYIGSQTANEIIVPAKLEGLPVYRVDIFVFDECKVPSIVFEDGIVWINSGFSTDVVSVILPSTLRYIGDEMFYSCDKLEKIVIPEGVNSIGSYAFFSCGRLSEISIPSSVYSIGEYAFRDCFRLTKVNFQNGLEKIGEGAFSKCPYLSSIVLPDTVEELGYGVFQESGLESIELPESVKRIGARAFRDCERLKAVKVYNATMTIETLEIWKVSLLFEGCPSDLVVYGKAGSTIAKCCADENVYFKVIQ